MPVFCQITPGIQGFLRKKAICCFASFRGGAGLALTPIVPEPVRPAVFSRRQFRKTCFFRLGLPRLECIPENFQKFNWSVQKNGFADGFQQLQAQRQKRPPGVK